MHHSTAVMSARGGTYEAGPMGGPARKRRVIEAAQRVLGKLADATMVSTDRRDINRTGPEACTVAFNSTRDFTSAMFAIRDVSIQKTWGNMNTFTCNVPFTDTAGSFTAVVAEGDDDASGLMTKLITAMNATASTVVYSGSYDPSSGKMTIYGTAAFTFTWSTATSSTSYACPSIWGFQWGVDSATGTSVTSVQAMKDRPDGTVQLWMSGYGGAMNSSFDLVGVKPVLTLTHNQVRGEYITYHNDQEVMFHVESATVERRVRWTCRFADVPFDRLLPGRPTWTIYFLYRELKMEPVSSDQEAADVMVRRSRALPDY